MNPVPATVRLRGTGVSITTAAHLLAADDIHLVGSGEPVSSAPVIMLSEAALALLRDVFGQPGMFAGRPQIARRVVAWGGGEAVRVPHDARVVTGADIAAELTAAPQYATTTASFTLHAAPPFPDTALRHFGNREAMATVVELAPDSDAQACHIEAVASGWLFLIPHGAGKAWLLGVGGEPDALLGQSRLVAAQVHTVGPIIARFETAPRMLETLTGDDWLALGTAAIAFDPLCGDGTAHAVREAILAAAVIAGIRDGGDRPALLGHYQSMLIAAMRRHLQISMSFYQSGSTSPWWREQADAVAQGYQWCTARLGAMPEPRFLLNGTRLVPRALAA